MAFLFSSTAAFSQSFEWARGGTGGGGVIGYATAVDSSGFLYVAGTFVANETEPRFDGLRVAGFGGEDIFLAKYNTNGVLIWIRRAGTSGPDKVDDLCVDRAGNIYMTGILDQTYYTFDTIAIDGDEARGVFWAKYNPYGGLLSVFRDTAEMGADYSMIACNQNDELFVVGVHENASQGFFIANYAQGVERWRKRVEGSGTATCSGIALAADGGFGITGMLGGAARFDTIEVEGRTNPFRDSYIARFNAEGKALWVKTEQHNTNVTKDGIGLDAENNFYIVRNANGERSISKYDAEATWLWTQSHSGWIIDIAVEPSGIFYTTGDTYDGNAFVDRFTRDGTREWIKNISGDLLVSGYSVTYDRQHNAYVTGVFGNQFPPSGVIHFDNIALEGGGAGSMFVAKVSGTSGVEDERVVSGITGDASLRIAPNPSTGATIVRFESASPVVARLVLYNARGEEIGTVSERYLDAGHHDIPLDLRDLPNGIYTLRLIAGTASHATRLVLVK